MRAGSIVGHVLTAPFTAIGMVPMVASRLLSTPFARIGGHPITLGGYRWRFSSPVETETTGAVTYRINPFLARQAWRVAGFGARSFFGLVEGLQAMGIGVMGHRRAGRIARAIERAVVASGRGTIEAVFGDVTRPWMSYQGRAGTVRTGTQMGLGITIGAGVGLYGILEGQGPPPPMRYAPYPGTTIAPPGIPHDNMGADGDLVHALHENYGSGRYL